MFIAEIPTDGERIRIVTRAYVDFYEAGQVNPAALERDFLYSEILRDQSPDPEAPRCPSTPPRD